LLSKERRPKHRYALLTVLSLTETNIIQTLLKNGLLKVTSPKTRSLGHSPSQILHQWLKDVSTIDSEGCTRFLVDELQLAIDWNLSEGISEWADILSGLRRHKLEIVQELSNQLFEKSSSKNTISETSTLEKEPEIRASNLDRVSRVEGLMAPLPRPFAQKTILPTKRKSTKSVHWAPEDSLIYVQEFYQHDPPRDLFKKRPIDIQIMSSEIEWMEPSAVDLNPLWQVQYGGESLETKSQDRREEQVAAVDPSMLIRDFDPEEPYYSDTRPDKGRSIGLLPLEVPSKCSISSTSAPAPTASI